MGVPQAHPLYNEQLRAYMAFGGDFENTARLADVCASITSADGAALQSILEELDVFVRWAWLLLWERSHGPSAAEPARLPSCTAPLVLSHHEYSQVSAMAAAVAAADKVSFFLRCQASSPQLRTYRLQLSTMCGLALW